MSNEHSASFALVSKIVFYICFSIVLCFWISSCRLNEKIITECKNSCKTFSSHMRSVTSRECECSSLPGLETNGQNDLWVLPNN